MKTNHYLLLLFFITCCFGNLMAQIPNAGFEDWEFASDSSLVPSLWETTSSAGYTTVLQATPAYAGNYSLHARVLDAGVVMLPGLLYCKFPLTSRPTALHLCYKSTVMPGDYCYIYFTAWQGDSTTVAVPDSCTFKVNSTVTNWTCTDLPLSYVLPINPDSGMILISAGNFSSGQLGTEIYVDELSFLGVGIDEQDGHAIPIQAYPNPASDVLMLSAALKRPASLTLSFFDVSGRKVLVSDEGPRPAGLQQLKISIRELPPGIYCCELKGDGAAGSCRFVVK